MTIDKMAQKHPAQQRPLYIFEVQLPGWQSTISVRGYDADDAIAQSRMLWKVPTDLAVTATLSDNPRADLNCDIFSPDGHQPCVKRLFPCPFPRVCMWKCNLGNCHHFYVFQKPCTEAEKFTATGSLPELREHLQSSPAGKRGRKPLAISAESICDALKEHGSIKAASRALGCSRGYIYKVVGVERVNECQK